MKHANGAALFGDGEVDLPLLRSRAHNLRWATVPDGVIPLTAADPDFRSAPEIAEAMARYTSERLFCYGPPQGLLSFREVIAETLAERRGISTTPDLILPVDSAAQGLFIVTRFCLEPGDEAIIFDPVDFLFERAVLEARGKPVRFPIDVPTGSFDYQLLKDLITPRTRLICLCNPHNPSGKVFTREELIAIGELAVENDPLDLERRDLVRHRVRSARSHVARLARAGDRREDLHRLWLQQGVRPRRAPGRIHRVAGPARARRGDRGFAGRDHCLRRLDASQVAAQAAFESAWYWVEAFVEHLTRLREHHGRAAQSPTRRSLPRPSGAPTSRFRTSERPVWAAQAVCNHLLKKGRVALVPGDPQWFGPRAAGHVRLCFSTSQALLVEALDRIEAAWPER